MKSKSGLCTVAVITERNSSRLQSLRTVSKWMCEVNYNIELAIKCAAKKSYQRRKLETLL
jgi:hypothetical protein